MTTRLESVTGQYGSAWTTGIISEHVPAAVKRGLMVRKTHTLTEWVYDPATTEKAVPVLCSELIVVWTEDGPTTGRCGLMAKEGVCEGHASVIREWWAQSDAELLAWERELDSR
jgi:hypothetical protein